MPTHDPTESITIPLTPATAQLESPTIPAFKYYIITHKNSSMLGEVEALFVDLLTKISRFIVFEQIMKKKNASIQIKIMYQQNSVIVR